jgi:aminopeptidase N
MAPPGFLHSHLLVGVALSFRNWGLVTYREVDLLIDPTLASSQQKQRVAVVVNHELAHQW